MLDDPIDAPSTETAPAATTPTRRRRAAGRPSGPPIPVESDLRGEEGAPTLDRAPSTDDVPGQVTTSEPTEKPKRTRKAPSTTAGDKPKRSRKTKPVAAEAHQTVVEPTTSDAAAGDAAPAESVAMEIPSAEVAVLRVDSADLVVSQPQADDAIGQALAVLETQRTSAPRRRSASRPAGAPKPIDLDAIAAALATDTAGDSPVDVVADEIADQLLADADAADAADLADSADIAEADADAPTAELVDVETFDAAVTLDPVLVEAAEDTEASDLDEETEDDLGDSDEHGDEAVPRRRRRRRGGRRRRRTGEGSATDEPGDHESQDDAEAEAGEPATDTAEPDPEGDAPVMVSRRRRRRRRGDDAAATTEEDGAEVVVRVREPRTRRRTPATTDEVTGIEGSTRMEAKRQRRREGRAAGRRRAPILTEAEFLARRESVARSMLVRQKDSYSQIAVLEDGILVEHYVDRASATSLIGNVYLGRVQNVLPSMEAAFVDIGRGRNAVLYAGEVDWDSFGDEGQTRQVEKVFKSGQSVLVQVTKDPVGAKGARLTCHVSLPGRYIVYAPGGHLSGISRKLPEHERARLKDLLGDLVPEEASVIIRTAAEGASEEELIRDVTRLKAQWESIEKKVKQGSAPQLLYGEPDLTVRIVRDLFTEDFTSLVVDGNGHGEDAWDTVSAYVSHVAPHLSDRLKQWNREADGDLFGQYRIDEQIAKALERKVFLPSGGSLIIDRTEAMTVIDVNTGKFTGSAGNLEATVTSNNLEAAEEIVRQLRLRDVGGIIVIDFIDMVLPSNRELLLRRLVECLGRDRTRHQVSEVTSLGLVQMTRKKIGTGLAEAFTDVCETCQGRGYHRHEDPVDSQEPSDGGDRNGRRRGRPGPNGS